MMTTEIREVLNVSRSGVTIRTEAGNVPMAWGVLRAAAVQEDAELAAAYRPLLAQALAAAKDLREVSIRVANDTATPHGHEARLYDVAGEFVSGRIVAADFGQAGSRKEAAMDVERAKERLAAKGYTVHDES